MARFLAWHERPFPLSAIGVMESDRWLVGASDEAFANRMVASSNALPHQDPTERIDQQRVPTQLRTCSTNCTRAIEFLRIGRKRVRKQRGEVVGHDLIVRPFAEITSLERLRVSANVSPTCRKPIAAKSQAPIVVRELLSWRFPEVRSHILEIAFAIRDSCASFEIGLAFSCAVFQPLGGVNASASAISALWM